MKKLLTSLCILVAAGTALGAPKKEEAMISLDPSDTLYVQIIDSVGLRYMNRNNRFREIKSTLEDVFEQADFPMAVDIVKFGGGRVPPGAPRLDLTIMRWGDNGFGQVEARFSASLKYDYDRNALGVFNHRGASSAMIGVDRQRREYNDVLSRALVEMVSELNLRLPMAAPDEAEEEDLPPESNPYVNPELVEEADE